MSSTAEIEAPAVARPDPTPWYRRVTTILLAGWCAGWALYLYAMLGQRYGCPRGQETCERVPATAHSWLWGLAGAVVLAALCVLEARRPAVASPASPQRRPRYRWLVLGGIGGAVLGANLVLLGPMVDNQFCVEPIHVNRVMAYSLNCDSYEFMHLAHTPGDVLEHHNARQSRPGYVVLSVVAERTIGPVAHWTGLDRLYKMRDRAQFPLVAINLAATAAGIALMASQLAGLGTPRLANAALCAFLAINGVTTAFTWTPHQQTFALLVPAATILAGRYLLLRRSPWWAVTLVGLAAGGASLVYGSFLITAAVAGLILLYQRRWIPLVGFLAGFGAPQVAWMALCKIVSGDYYNQETRLYDEFIWLPKAAKQGVDSLRIATHDMTITAGRAVFAICTVALLLIVGLAATAVLLRVKLPVLTDSQRATVVAAGLTAAAGIVFAWAIGIVNADRLLYHAVPALLVLAGWITARIAASSKAASRLVTAGVVVLAVAVLTNEIITPGPYS
ncbi:glycosyltransferase family 87 protein [Dactylosporangium sp. NPDC051485]|uniref:glycosyltransferase family 87 protein n=1 Tax=Dactylosporangium sp. NPDC051485 TaxID=3154846 RepID=UPI003434D8EF